jgi:hypothetical protein
LSAGLSVLFFANLGFWAFDLPTTRAALGPQFRWRTLADLAGSRSIGAFASIAVTSAGVAIGAVLTGQFTAVVTLLVQLAFPQLPMRPA